MEKKNIASNIFHIVGISSVIVGLLFILKGCGESMVKNYEWKEEKKEEETENARCKIVVDYLINRDIAGPDFKYPTKLEIGNVTLTYNEIEGSYILDKMFDFLSIRIRNGYWQNMLAAYKYEDDVKYEITEYFNRNYTRLYGTGEPLCGGINIYTDESNDARLYVLYNNYVGVFNKYRFFEHLDGLRKEAEKLNNDKNSVLNAGKINF